MLPLLRLFTVSVRYFFFSLARNATHQLLHCYWPLYESGGLFFHKLFRQVRTAALIVECYTF